MKVERINENEKKNDLSSKLKFDEIVFACVLQFLNTNGVTVGFHVCKKYGSSNAHAL